MESRFFNDNNLHSSKKFDRCQFAKTCNGGDGIMFPSLFCTESESAAAKSTGIKRQLNNFLDTISHILLIIGLALVLLLLFRLLNSTTDEFFSPGLELFSLHLGLPPRFAGVVSAYCVCTQLLFIHTCKSYTADVNNKDSVGTW
jgi:hypothetical protein